VPSGCPFHPRCHRAVETCATVLPPLAVVAGRSVACHESESMFAPQPTLGGDAR
jgi:oligopeptide transport system ATP-binding protein